MVLLILDLLQAFGLLLTGLVLDDGLEVLVVLCLLDVLPKFLVHPGELHLLKIGVTDRHLLVLILLHDVESYLLVLLRAEVSFGVVRLGLLHFSLLHFVSLLHLHLDVLLVLKVLEFLELLLNLECLFLGLDLV